MNRRPDSLTNDGANAYAVYVGDDILCVGRIEAGLRESLRRVAYRDVSSMTAWDGRRRHARIVGGVVLAGFLALALLVALADAPIAVPVACVVIGFVLFGFLMWSGRLGGVTRFRGADSARVRVDGVIGGSYAKRERILAMIEERIRTRQGTYRDR